MKKEIIGIEGIKTILPCDWEKQAKELGAMTRGRKIKSAEELLILNLLYQTSGKSLGGTSSILKSCEKIEMSKQAVGERLIKSMEWNRWLCENINRNAGILGEKPSWLEYRRVYQYIFMPSFFHIFIRSLSFLFFINQRQFTTVSAVAF